MVINAELKLGEYDNPSWNPVNGDNAELKLGEYDNPSWNPVNGDKC